ncbi:hypothetical protein LTR85_011853 [Meristemomyces frigidus]|nr:hypothetical protein LTR85_011853 [Meristemomyces frigidus]
MEASTLVGTYRRYKAGTQKLVKWLTDSATLCNPSSPLAPAAAPSAAELLAYATRIVASADPTIKVPIEIVDVARDAVLGRQSCAEWYAALAKGQPESSVTAQSNVRHQYFLDVLREVFRILLKAHKAGRPKRKKKMPELAADGGDLTNLFVHLEFEEPTISTGDEIAGAEDEVPCALEEVVIEEEQPAELPPTYELGDEEEKKSFAIWCLLKDMYDVRMYVRDMWRRYKEGELSFFAVSKMTNIAFDIIVQTCEEFGKQHPGLATFNDVVSFMGADSFIAEARHQQCGLATDSGKREQAEQLSDKDRSDLLCMPAWCALSDFRDVLPFVWSPDHPIVAGRKLHIKFPSHPFEKALLHIAFDLKSLWPSGEFPERTTAASNGSPFLNLITCLDAYTQRLLFMVMCGRSSKLPMLETGLLAATQIYMDIYDALDGDLARGVSETKDVFDRIHAVAQQSRDFFSNLSVHGNKNVDAKRAAGVLDGMENVVQIDQQEGPRRGWTFQLKGLPYRAFIPLTLIETLPLLAGHQVWNPLFVMHHAGINFLNINQTLLAAAHLYRAADVCGVIERPWADMNFVIDRLNGRAPFLRQTDGSIRSVSNTYRLALGMSLNQVSRGAQAVLPQPTFCAQHSRRATSTSDYMQAAGKASVAASGSYAKSRLGFCYEWLKVHISEGNGIKDETIASQWTETKRLSPVQLLSVLLESFVADEPYFNFDYINFFSTCTTVVETAVNDSFELTSKSQPEKPVKHMFGLYELVDMLLAKAAEAEVGGMSKRGSHLRVAGNIINATVQSSGHAYMKKSLKASSGHIPVERQPSARYRSCSGQRQSQPAADWITFADDAPDEAMVKHPETEAEIIGVGCKMLEMIVEQGHDAEGAVARTKAWTERALRQANIYRKCADINIEGDKVRITIRAMTTQEIQDSTTSKQTCRASYFGDGQAAMFCIDATQGSAVSKEWASRHVFNGRALAPVTAR